MTRISKLLVFVVEGVSSYSYSCVESQCPNLSENDACVDILMPSAYDGNLVEEMSHIPISPGQRRQLLETHGSVDWVLKNYKHLKYKVSLN